MSILSKISQLRSDPAAYLKFFAQADRLGSLLGARWTSIDASECVCEYTASPEHYNPNGILHGGALYTIMDSCQGALVHFTLDEAFKAAATGTSVIKYLAPIEAGTIVIRTRITGQERRKIFVSTSATNSDGVQVASLEEIWIGIPKD